MNVPTNSATLPLAADPLSALTMVGSPMLRLLSSDAFQIVPNSGPQSVGNSFTAITHLDRGIGVSHRKYHGPWRLLVLHLLMPNWQWTVDITSGALTLAWTNAGQCKDLRHHFPSIELTLLSAPS